MSRVAKESLEEAREQLLIEISNYSAVTKGKIVCVFDAYDRGTPQSEYEYHGCMSYLQKSTKQQIVLSNAMSIIFIISIRPILR